MNSSILEDIKSLVGPDTYEDFEIDLIIHINTALGILNQVGVGPAEGFAITGSAETWDDFVTNPVIVQEVKSYVYLKVRLLFDPPQSAAAIDSMKALSDELIWRIQVKADPT